MGQGVEVKKPKDLKEAWNRFEEALRRDGDTEEGIQEVKLEARAAIMAGGEYGDYWKWRLMEQVN